MLFEQRHGRLGNWQFSFAKNRDVSLAQGVTAWGAPADRHAFDANLIREVESAVIFPDATEVAALVGRPGERSVAGCYLKPTCVCRLQIVAADDAKLIAPGLPSTFCSLAHSREKTMGSSILHRCIGMLILPAADMSWLVRRRRSMLRRK